MSGLTCSLSTWSQRYLCMAPLFLRILPTRWRSGFGVDAAQHRAATELTSQADVAEARAGHSGAIQSVAAIQYNRGTHQARQRLPIELTILRPLGYQHQGVGVSSHFLRRLTAMDIHCRV